MRNDTYYTHKSLTFSLIDADVEIIGVDDELIDYEIKKSANITVKQDQNGFYFEQKPANSVFELFTKMGTEIFVYVPSDMILESIEINYKAGGDVKVEHIEAIDFEEHTPSGDIKINDSQIEELYLKSMDGDVIINRCELEEVYIANEDGDIEGSRIEARNINLASTSGDVDIKCLDASNIFVRTVSGDIDIEIDGRYEDYHITVNTMNTFKESNDGRNRKLDLSTVSGEVDYTFMD